MITPIRKPPLGRLAKKHFRNPHAFRDRLVTHLVVDPVTGCWIFTGAKDRDGYGLVSLDQCSTLVHRAMFWLTHDQEPKRGQEVGHSRVCQHRACCRPGHLRLQTHGENMAQSKGNPHVGGVQSKGKLHEEDVVALRMLSKSGKLNVRKAARELGVDPHAVRKAVKGETYRNMPWYF